MDERQSKTHLKYSTNVKRYPCCSATPAHTTFADAPINVPFPEICIQNNYY